MGLERSLAALPGDLPIQNYQNPHGSSHPSSVTHSSLRKLRLHSKETTLQETTLQEPGHTCYTNTHAEKTSIHQHTSFSLKSSNKRVLLHKFEYKQTRKYK